MKISVNIYPVTFHVFFLSIFGLLRKNIAADGKHYKTDKICKKYVNVLDLEMAATERGMKHIQENMKFVRDSL